MADPKLDNEDLRDSSADEGECDCCDHADHQAPSKIAYMTIYESKDDYRDRGYFMPGYAVTAKIVHAERDASSAMHLFNPYVYTIELEHGQFKWTVIKRYKDFNHLHTRMLLHRASEKIKQPVRALERSLFFDDSQEKGLEEGENTNNAFDQTDDAFHVVKQQKELEPTGHNINNGANSPAADAKAIEKAADQISLAKSTEKLNISGHGGDSTVCSHGKDHASHRHSVTMNTTSNKSAKKPKACRLPEFPRWPESIIGTTDLETRRSALENYLQSLLNIPAYRRHHETAEFLEVSRFSFVHNLGLKGREGTVKKQPGGRMTFTGWKRFCIDHLAHWSRRYLFVKDSFIAYMDPGEESLNAVMLFDNDFLVQATAGETEGRKHGLTVTNKQRRLNMQCYSDAEAELWRQFINKVTAGPGACWLKSQKHGSSYPPRDNSYAQWFCDGEGFMSHAASVMELAQEEIFISDWWLSPEIFMKRPMTEGNRWRLDEIIKRKASQGIKVFVLLYKEVEMALGINSLYSKRKLQELGENVLRHPDHALLGGGTFLWAHHEKLIVVDQSIAFVGGIDLCYGRWDNARHHLTDIGSVQMKKVPEQKLTFMSGMRSLVGNVPMLSSDSVDPSGDTTAVDLPNSTECTVQAMGGEMEMIPLRPATCSKADDSNTTTTVVTTKTATTVVDGEVTAKSHSESDTQRTSTSVANEDTADTGPNQSVQGKIDGVSGTMLKALLKDNEKGVDVAGHDQSTSSAHQPGAAKQRFRNFASRVRKSRSSVDETNESKGIEVTGVQTEAEDKQGADLSVLVKEYTNAVKSGKIQSEKERGDSPPPETKRKKLKRQNSMGGNASITKTLNMVLGKWGNKKAQQRWRVAEDDDKLFGKDYDIKWLKMMASQPDEMDLVGSGKTWIGKDYVNFIFKDFTDLDLPYHDFIDRLVTPRMPWHDIHSVVYGAAARDVARHFIERWNATKVEKSKYDGEYPFLMPKSYENVKVPRLFRNMSHKCQIQIVRSVCEWSAGVAGYEDSIQMAYLSTIANSKHYVYIENQFFVSMVNHSEVRNEINKALCDRIVRAHEQDEKFRVYIMLPLLPGFEGQLGATGGGALEAVLHWSYLSISVGQHSLLECLRARGITDIDKYVVIGGLRTFDNLANTLVTELIYIHSKLMIVDDKYVIIGSANVNDRSQAGKRDSEVAIFVEDTEFSTITLDGKPFQSGTFAGSMRRHLFEEHLGLLPEQQVNKLPTMSPVKRPLVNVEDCLSDEFWTEVWWKTARTNTEVYEQVFHVIPTDKVLSLAELPTYQQAIPMVEYNPQVAKEQLQRIRGHLVLFPTLFLSKSNLAPSITTKEGMAPTSLFT